MSIRVQTPAIRVDHPAPGPPPPTRDIAAVPLAAVLRGLSHALDLTEGHPRGHAARSCRIGRRIADALGLPAADRVELEQALLLKDAGCSSNAPVVYDLFGGDDQAVKRAVWLHDWRRLPEQLSYAWEYVGRGGSLVAKFRRLGRFALIGPRTSGERIFTVRCERGATIAGLIGLSPRVADAIRAMDEHWDGGGYPYGLRGTETPLFARIIGLAQVMEIFWGDGGPVAAVRVARERVGRWFDPALVETLHAFEHDQTFWDGLDADDEQPAPLGASAFPSLGVDAGCLDRIADAFALIIDAKSPFTFDHSRRVAAYAHALNVALGAEGVDPVRLRHAALLHDIGKLTVPNRVLDKPGALDADEWALVRQHPVFTSSILQGVPLFEEFADDAANHHEWMNGRGYSRGLSGADLSTTARILAVADVVDALAADRPYRRGMPTEKVHAILCDERGTHLDDGCVSVCGPDLIEGVTSRLVPGSVQQVA